LSISRFFDRFVLFKRLPRIYWRYKPEPLLTTEQEEQVPALAKQVRVLREELLPAYWQLDEEAGRAQNAYRLYTLLVLVGNLLVTSLSSLALIFAASWFGSFLRYSSAALAIVQSGLPLQARASALHEQFLHARAGAEQLRREFFLFLGSLGEYQEHTHALERLRNRVPSLVRGEGETTSHTDLPALQLKLHHVAADGQFLALYWVERYANQYTFYAKRFQEFSHAVRQAGRLNRCLLLCISLAALVQQIEVSWLKVLCLIIMALCPTLATGLTAFVQFYGFQEQARLYQTALQGLAGVRQQFPPEEEQDAARVVTEVEQVLALEQGDWLAVARKMVEVHSFSQPPTGAS
jgi:hypothetical protein